MHDITFLDTAWTDYSLRSDLRWEYHCVADDGTPASNSDLHLIARMLRRQKVDPNRAVKFFLSGRIDHRRHVELITDRQARAIKRALKDKPELGEEAIAKYKEALGEDEECPF